MDAVRSVDGLVMKKAAAVACDWVSWLNHDYDPGVYVRHPMPRDFTSMSLGVRVQVFCS